MKRRLVIPGIALGGPGAAFELDQEAAHYLRDVLRLEAGAEFWLFDGAGRRAEVVLSSLTKRLAVAEIRSVLEIEPPRPSIELVQVVGKGDKMDLVVRQCTELGVSSIRPVWSERSVAERRARRPRWQSIALDAVRVSGRAFAPQIHEPVELEVWLAEPRADVSLCFTGAEARGLREFADLCSSAARIEAVVGPEGGFSERELDALRAAGTSPASLGAFTLRTETAGAVAVALLMYLSGRLGASGEG